MIRLYPSRHDLNLYPSQEGQAIQSYEVLGPISLADWLKRNVRDFDLARESHPISIDVEGVTVEPSEWAGCLIAPESDVRIYPVPRATGAAIAAWAAVAIAAVALVYALTLNTDTPDSSSSSGDSLELNPAKANSVRLAEPIREVLGRDRVYPDYIVQPVSRFLSGRDVRTSMFLCVGAGRYSILPSSMKIGQTPFSAFGDEVSYSIYGPGEDVSGDARSESWYVAPEVGSSRSATAGLDLDSPVETVSASADGVALSGTSVTILGNSAELPSTWQAGTVTTLVMPETFQVSTSSGYSKVAGPLNELAPFAGMLVTLTTNTDEFDLVVDSFSPYVAPTPGVGGSPSSVVGSAAPTTYDYTDAPVAWSLTYRGVTRQLSLIADYVNMSGVVSEITSQLSGIGLTAQDDSGRLRISEPLSPYQGGEISQSGAPASLFGVSPIYTVGTASTGGVPEQLAFITLRYDNGVPFSGLPLGTQRLAIGYRQNRYQIESIDGLTITVSRLTESGVIDEGWPGFSARTLLDFQMTSESSSEDNWIGPFMACPEGETVDRIEWDIFFPGGLVHSNKKGQQETYYSRVIVQWADAETGEWNTIEKLYSAKTQDGFGHTEGLDLPTPIRPMVRVRRAAYVSWENSQDTTQWYALRGRLLTRPARYEGVTTIAVTVRTGDRLSAQSDRQVNLVATRLYDSGDSRTISAAARHVCSSLGLPASQIDTDQMQALEDVYWTPRGETFDHQFVKQETALDVLRMIFNAGMGDVVLTDGMVSAVREGATPARGMITPHEQASELKCTFTAPSVDDYTGVDVKYVDPVTFAEETIECRVPGVDALKIETYTATGVQDATRAWRIGMRRLMKYLYQRVTYQTSTEMEARVYEYLDHIILTDDIPGNQTVSCLIEDIEIEGGTAIITVSETLDWSITNPRCVIRLQDGSTTPLLTPSRISDDQLALPSGAVTFDVDWSLEPPRLMFCSSSEVGYAAMIDSTEPDADGRCSVTAKQYSDAFYTYDDSQPA